MNLEKAKAIYARIIEFMKKQFTGKLVVEIDMSEGGITQIHINTKERMT